MLTTVSVTAFYDRRTWRSPQIFRFSRVDVHAAKVAVWSTQSENLLFRSSNKHSATVSSKISNHRFGKFKRVMKHTVFYKCSIQTFVQWDNFSILSKVGIRVGLLKRWDIFVGLSLNNIRLLINLKWYIRIMPDRPVMWLC